MNHFPYQSAPPPPPPRFAMLPPDRPISSSFWDTRNVSHHLKELHDTLNLAKSMQKELEVMMMIKDGRESVDGIEKTISDPSISGVLNYLEDRGVDMKSQELFSIEATTCLMSRLKAQLEPYRFVVDERTPWEEKSAVVRLSGKVQKSKRNKLWRKRKRKHAAELLAEERERFDQADEEADEWRAREIAKDIAKRKVEKMKEIAKLKAKEERKRLESELELVLIAEKLQELRTIRIQKLKKQGHFLPEEDDKFLDRVRAAVEEEERQALAAADTDAAKDAILTAEESRKTSKSQVAVSKDATVSKDEIKENKDQATEEEDIRSSDAVTRKESDTKGSGKQYHAGQYDNLANLPIEFYHYYHGSNYDMGTLIEVRRTWDAYIRPGGRRIPGHWVQPPPPADEIWASYIVKPK